VENAFNQDLLKISTRNLDTSWPPGNLRHLTAASTAMAGKPDRRDGRAPTTSAGTGRPRPDCRSSCVPGLPDPPRTTCRRPSCTCLYPGGGAGADDPARRGPCRAALAVSEATVHQGCDRGGLLRGRHVRPASTAFPRVPGSSWGCWGPGRQVQRPPSAAGSTGSAACPQRGRPSASPAQCPASLTKFHAVHGRAAWCPGVPARPAGMYGTVNPHRPARFHHRGARRTRNRSGAPRAASFSPATRRRGDLR